MFSFLYQPPIYQTIINNLTTCSIFTYFDYSDNTLTVVINSTSIQLSASTYLAIRWSFSTGAGRGVPLYFRGCLRHSNPDKVDDMVQVGKEVSAREPAVMTVLLDARLLEAQDTNCWTLVCTPNNEKIGVTHRPHVSPHLPCCLEPGYPSPALSGTAPYIGHAQTYSDDPSISGTYQTINTGEQVKPST